MADTFRPQINLPKWRGRAATPALQAAGHTMCHSMLNNRLRDPRVWLARGATASIDTFYPEMDGWLAAIFGSLVVSGGALVLAFKPSGGPTGTLAAGWTSSKGALTTAIPNTVGVNQLADRGDGVGYFIRVNGSSAGGSGKSEVRQIIANTSSTTPTLTVSPAFSFTPASGDAYEILWGRVYACAGTTGFAYLDVPTLQSTARSTTNLAAAAQEPSLIVMDELHVPWNRVPGEGYLDATFQSGTPVTYDVSNADPYPAITGLRCLQATATATGTLTGHTTGGDNSIPANYFRNFQLRIVEDTGTPTAVGQRRRIASHTGGAATTPVYTLSANWTVTPSATAKYVIENNNDWIIHFQGAQLNTYTYSISGNTWDTTTFSAAGSNHSSGSFSTLNFGLLPDGWSDGVLSGNTKWGLIYCMRGGSTAVLDVLDITAATTGTWSSSVAYFGAGSITFSFTAGSCAVMDPINAKGEFWYISLNGTQTFLRFNLRNRVLEPWTWISYPQGAGTSGCHMALTTAIDSSGVKRTFLLFQRSTGQEMFDIMLQSGITTGVASVPSPATY